MADKLKPTESELEILNALWRLGPSTVRQVHEALATHRPVGYTTVLKLMQIMLDKQLVTRDESQRSHVYKPTASQKQTQRQLLKDLTQRAFGGSSRTLVMQALAGRKPSAKDIQEIRDMLDQLDGGPS